MYLFIMILDEESVLRKRLFRIYITRLKNDLNFQSNTRSLNDTYKFSKSLHLFMLPPLSFLK